MNPIEEKKERELLWRWIWVSTFAVAFAWVETAVVLYLREKYFHGSFYFPIFIKWEDGKLVIDHIMRVELGREIATILMLASVGCMAGKNAWQKFSFFMIAFGIWDIFYYIWLWVAIRWPESLMTWDLLFFVPLPWVGPVITPALIALVMVVAGTLIIYFDDKGIPIRWRWYDWAIILGCGFLMIVAFCWDWRNIIQKEGAAHVSPVLGMPNPFAWWLYLPAYFISVTYFGFRMWQNIQQWKARQT